MKEHATTTDAADVSQSKPGVRDGNPEAPAGRSDRAGHKQLDRDGVLKDQKLVERCLAGEVAAWEEFYEQCHDQLLVLIRGMLHQPDASLIDEIGARVWYSLIANDGKLLGRYDPRRGARLITFMRALARDEAARYYRTEARRHERERKALQEKPRYHAPEVGQTVSSLDEFLAALSPRERGFCRGHLLAGEPVEVEPPKSAAGIRQLSHRIYQKLLKFVAPES